MSSANNTEKYYKWLFWAMAVLALLLMIFFTSVLVQSKREQQAHKAQLDQLLVELADTLQSTEDKQEYLDRLMRDQEFRERVIREKLGHARPDEMIFHFEK